MKEILSVLPLKIKRYMSVFTEKEWGSITEIRLRTGKPVEVVKTVDDYAGIKQAPLFTATDAADLMGLLSQYSVYRLEEELRRGYITIAGGHRVGIAGKVVVENGKVKGLREIGSFNIRIAKEKIGVSSPYLSKLYKDGSWTSTLIIGPPKTGKTTLLRDVARQISSGAAERKIRPHNAGIVDERSEIAGCINGVPQHTFGLKVDILDGCPKADGMMMMIRSMSPEVLIVDEIGRNEDALAVMEAVHAGVAVICSAHGKSLKEVSVRPAIKELLEMGTFKGVITLSDIGSTGCYKSLNPDVSPGRQPKVPL